MMFAWLMGLATISPVKLHEIMGREAVVPIDVNARQGWLQARVPGALNLDPTEYGERDLPNDKQTALVFYCSNPLCRKAPTAAKRATQLGYGNVRVMSAGIAGWIDAGLPTESGDRTVARGDPG
jgi:rhodanese-related sulfurtransferase